MPYPKHSILIVDRRHDFGVELRQRLTQVGVRVHVVGSAEAAIALARSKKISAAVLPFELDAWTSHLCSDLRDCGVRTVFNGMATELVAEIGKNDVSVP
jgi:ActR/RegA family two-component response regulator